MTKKKAVGIPTAPAKRAFLVYTDCEAMSPYVVTATSEEDAVDEFLSYYSSPDDIDEVYLTPLSDVPVYKVKKKIVLLRKSSVQLTKK